MTRNYSGMTRGSSAALAARGRVPRAARAGGLPSGQRPFRFQQTLAHHQLGVLNRIECCALPKVVATDPERETVVQSRVDADASNAALHLFCEIEGRRIFLVRRE